MIRYQIPRADYTYTVDGNIIAIIDLDLGSRSVTNDMENVLAEIRAELGDLAGYSIIYRDSMRRWDGVRLVNGVTHFYGLNEEDPQMAMRHLLHPITE
jgi:hypothetical protein